MRNKKRKKSALSEHEAGPIDQDDQFYFIVGYTEGGVPYGVTWEEYEAQSLDKGGSEGEPQLKEIMLKKCQFQDLIETYDLYSDGIEHFLNIDTGEIVTINSFDRKGEDEELSEAIEEGFNEIYYRIPCRESHEGYLDMEDFTYTVTNEKLRAKLSNVMIGGKKVFRRFKNALSSDAHELDRYYRFVESRNKERVLDWLESINVKVVIGE